MVGTARRRLGSAGALFVLVAATSPIERIRDAVALQAGRRVHGQIVVTL